MRQKRAGADPSKGVIFIRRYLLRERRENSGEGKQSRGVQSKIESLPKNGGAYFPSPAIK